jgi:hypothetical protein
MSLASQFAAAQALKRPIFRGKEHRATGGSKLPQFEANVTDSGGLACSSTALMPEEVPAFKKWVDETFGPPAPTYKEE